jgi:hypothetical protein
MLLPILLLLHYSDYYINYEYTHVAIHSYEWNNFNMWYACCML